jgi:hypothetical protein
MTVKVNGQTQGIEPQAAKMRLLAAFQFFLTAWGVFAQNSEQGGFSPFVSQLMAETRNNLVRLSWIDSRDARGPVYIFRSTSPFTGTSTGGLSSIRIAYGTQFYIDETDGAGFYYYFVAASDTGGQRYDVFIPYTNTIAAVFSSSPLGEEPSGPAAQFPPVQTSEARQSSESLISGLAARVESEGVIISFAVSGSQKSTVLYRNTQPIRRIQDLMNAAVVRSGIRSPFIDHPAPGSSYYYAVLFEEDISRGLVEIQPGRNSTINAVEVTGRTHETAPDIRSMPLPSLSIFNTSPAASDFYSNLPSPAPLWEETARTLDTVQRSRSSQPPLKHPRVFARDLEAAAEGEESILGTVIQGPFARREWQRARDDLLAYLSLPRSTTTEARARFYLGQAYYYSGKNREALIEFLFVQSRYANEANEWIEAILAVLAD